MTFKDERTPGTTGEDAPDDADDSAAASADPADGSDSDDASDEDEVTRLRRVNAQLLSEKKSVKAAQADVERLQRELTEARGGGTHTPTADPSRGELDETRARLNREGRAQFDKDRQLLAELKNPNIQPTADHFYAQGRMLEALLETTLDGAREKALERELRKVPGPLRDRAEELIRAGDVNTVKAAQAWAEREAELAELKNGKTKPPADEDDEDEDPDERKRIRREREPEPPRRGVTRGEVRARTVPESQYRAQLQAFREAGDSIGMNKLITERSTGKIIVKTGA